MITKQYLYDLEQWEVVVLAENARDDKRIGLFDTMEEAQAVVEEWK